MTILTLTVRKGIQISRGRHVVTLPNDTLVDVVVDEAKAQQLVYRAILNKKGKVVVGGGALAATVRRS